MTEFDLLVQKLGVTAFTSLYYLYLVFLLNSHSSPASAAWSCGTQAYSILSPFDSGAHNGIGLHTKSWCPYQQRKPIALRMVCIEPSSHNTVPGEYPEESQSLGFKFVFRTAVLPADWEADWNGLLLIPAKHVFSGSIEQLGLQFVATTLWAKCHILTVFYISPAVWECDQLGLLRLFSLTFFSSSRGSDCLENLLKHTLIFSLFCQSTQHRLALCFWSLSIM